jgi:hypothetical protein
MSDLADFAARRRGEEVEESYPGQDEEREHTPSWARGDAANFDPLDYWRDHLRNARPGSAQFARALEEIKKLEGDKAQRSLRDGSVCPTCGSRLATPEEDAALLAIIVAALDRPEEEPELEHVSAPPAVEEEAPPVPPAAVEPAGEEPEVAVEPSGISPSGTAVLSGEADDYYFEPPVVERVSVLPAHTGKRSRTGETLSPDAGLARGAWAEPHGHETYDALKAARES